MVLAGGVAGVAELRRELLAAQREQQRLCADLTQSTQRMKTAGAPKVAVDAVFARRLLKILAMCAGA